MDTLAVRRRWRSSAMRRRSTARRGSRCRRSRGAGAGRRGVVGWKDIGYHWMVMLDGTVQPGRPETQIGSQVASHNTGTLGMVYVGGVAADG